MHECIAKLISILNISRAAFEFVTNLAWLMLTLADANFLRTNGKEVYPPTLDSPLIFIGAMYSVHLLV